MRLQFEDGRIFQGCSAAEVVTALFERSFGAHTTPDEYITWAVGQARELQGVAMSVEGTTFDTRATSFVNAMVFAGLAVVTDP